MTTKIVFPLKRLGAVAPRNAAEIEDSNWFLGCETLDRDYADFDQYKEYLCPLGIKYLRFQGGWARVVDDAFERACLWKIITEGKIVVEICLRL